MNALLNYNINMAPTRVELELTEACNLKCLFCYNSQKPIISVKPIEIIEKLAEEGVMEIVLTGGEPLIHPDFANILGKCCEVISKVMIQTNGTFIDKRMAALIKKSGVISVNVSIHGLKKDHERLTLVEGSYEKAFTGIQNLINEGMNVSSNFVITDQNYNCLRESILALYKIGVRNFSLTRFTPTGVGRSNREISLKPENLLITLEIAEQMKKDYPDISIILANSVPSCALPIELKHFCEHCHFGISRFYIDVSGNVLMCGMSRIVLGNILEKGFAELKANSLVYKMHVCGEDVPAECTTCKEFAVCRGGCRAAAYAIKQDIYAKDPYFKERGIKNDFN